MKKTLFFTLGLCLAFLLPAGAGAAPDSYEPDLAYDPVDNHYLSVFVDVFNATASVCGELRDAAGQQAGDRICFSESDNPAMRASPAVDWIGQDDRFLVVWSEYDPLADTNVRYWRVVGRVVDSDGLPLGSPIPIAEYTSQEDMSPQLACCDGICLVVWQTRFCYTLGERMVCIQAIEAREVDADGTLLQTAPFLVAPFEELSRVQAFPAVACDPGGGRSLVVWQDDLNIETSGRDIHGRIVQKGGALIGGEMVHSSADSDQTLPAVAFDRVNERYLIAWTDARNAEMQGADIYGCLADSAGAPIGGDFPISDSTDETFDPAVAFLEKGQRFLVAWQDDRGGELTGWDIHGRFLDAQGGPDGLEITIAETGSRDTRPALYYNSLDVSVLAAYETIDDDIPIVAYQLISGRKPPTASAGDDQSVVEGSLVTLDGTASAPWDPAAPVVSYQWTQVGGVPVVLDGAGTAIATFTAPPCDAAGLTLAFRLVVTDSAGLEDDDAVQVQVTDLPLPPIADAGDDQFVDEGSLVTLDGSRSLPSDPAYPITAFRWIQVGGPPVSLSDAQAALATFVAPHVPLEGASLVFELEVSDASGLRSFDTVAVTVDDRSPRTYRLALPGGVYVAVGFPVEADPPLLNQITAQIGAYSVKRFRMFRWDPAAAVNIEIVSPAWGSEQACIPGRGYWAISRDPITLDMTGTPASIRRPFRIVLRPGWNQITNPFFFDVAWNERILVSDGGGGPPISVTSQNNRLSSRVILGYEAAVGQYVTAPVMLTGHGYWIENLTSADVELLVPPESTSPSAIQESVNVNGSRSRRALPSPDS